MKRPPGTEELYIVCRDSRVLRIHSLLLFFAAAAMSTCLPTGVYMRSGLAGNQEKIALMKREPTTAPDLSVGVIVAHSHSLSNGNTIFRRVLSLRLCSARKFDSPVWRSI